MEVTCRDDHVLVREHCRVVGDGVDFLTEDLRHVGDGVFRSAVHLRDATERIRVLHMLFLAGYHLAAFQEVTETLSGDNLSAVMTDLMNLVVERLDAAVESVQRDCANHIGEVLQTECLEQHVGAV